MNDKQNLRRKLRKARRQHVDGLPGVTRALLFRRPPAPLTALIPQDAIIGLYQANDAEAPTASYADFFFEGGHTLALPYFSRKDSAMEFRAHADPFDETGLEAGPFDILQPRSGADTLIPDVLFAPLLGFTQTGARLGQGGGHYDRWLAKHPDTIAIGLAWDAQLVESLPLEPHDASLTAIVTPTRLYGPFHA